MSRPHHRPLLQGDEFFDAMASSHDPAEETAAADRAATLVVRGARDAGDDEVAQRIATLTETEGIEAIAELWSGAPAESLGGCLWRLHALRAFVYASPARVAEEYEAGRESAPVAQVVAGVAEPPGPDELQHMVDEVLRGIARRDFADVLLRASAFARVVAAGRATLAGESVSTSEAQATGGHVAGIDGPAGVEQGDTETRAAGRLLTVAEQLERAAHLELAGELH